MSGSLFQFDASTLAAIAKIRDAFGAKDNAEAIQKALSLANLAIEKSDAQNVIIIVEAGSKLAESAGFVKIDLKS